MESIGAWNDFSFYTNQNIINDDFYIDLDVQLLNNVFFFSLLNILCHLRLMQRPKNQF